MNAGEKSTSLFLVWMDGAQTLEICWSRLGFNPVCFHRSSLHFFASLLQRQFCRYVYSAQPAPDVRRTLRITGSCTAGAACNDGMHLDVRIGNTLLSLRNSFPPFPTIPFIFLSQRV